MYIFLRSQFCNFRTWHYFFWTQCYVFRGDICNPSPGKAAIERRKVLKICEPFICRRHTLGY